MCANRTFKRYPKEDSPLYKLSNRRKLGSLLKTNAKDLERSIYRSDNYRIYSINKNTSKSRLIEEPKSQLKLLHHRLFTLLQRIESPDYLHSGIKGKSYITNANAHIGAKRLLKLDIQRFYPSTRQWHVYKFFLNTMKCSSDVAGNLANLSTCNSHVPTGSCLSQIIAFYAHMEMFSEIYNLASERNLTMTCYVDDITISGESVNRHLLFSIRGILKKNGLRSHPRKERIYLIGIPREVTGSIVTENRLLLPNRKHKEIHEINKSLKNYPDDATKLAVIEALVGKIVAATQVDSRHLCRLNSLKQERNRISQSIKQCI